MPWRKSEDTVISKTKNYMAVCGELALEEAMYLLQDRLNCEWLKVVSVPHYIRRHRGTWGNGAIAPHILNLSTRWRLVATSMLRRHWPRGERAPNTRGGGGNSRTDLGPVAKTKTWTQWEIEPRFPGRQACNVFTILTDLSNPVYARACQQSAVKATQSESDARRRMYVTVWEDQSLGSEAHVGLTYVR